MFAHVGLEYFKALAALLRRELEADSAFAAIIHQAEEQRPKLMTGQEGDSSTVHTYPFGRALTRALLGNESIFIPAGARARVRDDPYLEKHEIEGLAAISVDPGKDAPYRGVLILLRRDGFPAGDSVPARLTRQLSRTRAEFIHYAAEAKLKETISQALLLNYSKSMFMANISHELRNPIGTMVGYAALIRDGDIDKKTLRNYASQICAAGENLLTLIGDVMSLAMLEISDETTRKEKFDLVDIARTGRRLIEQQAAAKNLTLRGATGMEPIMVEGDAAHTKKALMNLLTNAVKYTSRGTIEITVGLAADGSARLSVIDTGVGMSEEEKLQACEPLGTFTHAYDMHQEGAGLGLPITMLLMQRQGARLEIESTKGEGTSAHLIFPPKLVLNEEGDFI